MVERPQQAELEEARAWYHRLKFLDDLGLLVELGLEQEAAQRLIVMYDNPWAIDEDDETRAMRRDLVLRVAHIQEAAGALVAAIHAQELVAARRWNETRKARLS